MQLRALQTLAEVATEHNSTLVFPIPIEILAGFMKAGAPHGLNDLAPFAVAPAAASALSSPGSGDEAPAVGTGAPPAEPPANGPGSTPPG
jgi:hypothetical protein